MELDGWSVLVTGTSQNIGRGADAGVTERVRHVDGGTYPTPTLVPRERS